MNIQELPIDIQLKIYQDVMTLRKPRKINKSLLQDIQSYNDLTELIHSYKKDFGTDGNRHLHWLENNILSYINGYIPLLLNINNRFYSIFPNKSLDEIQEHLFYVSDDQQYIIKMIKRLWFRLCYEEREEFIDHQKLHVNIML
mgnify:CR=1 FL=1|jgi:hypothetical protein|tara:strand:- start:1879 stop:2307 length:429 start_codon:yes stop_codon:yes gene_type:complete